MTTKIPYGLGELSNEDRLTTIKDRCIGEDLIEMYKVVRQFSLFFVSILLVILLFRFKLFVFIVLITSSDNFKDAEKVKIFYLN